MYVILSSVTFYKPRKPIKPQPDQVTEYYSHSNTSKLICFLLLTSHTYPRETTT